MSENRDNTRSDADAELEREVRADRQFTLSEAIGRMAGPGMMKGVSPVTRKRQAEAAIEDYLRRNLTDAGSVLCAVLLRGVSDSDLLLGDYDHPLVVLASYVRQVLGSDYRLRELVRQADVEWGRVNGERPHFERPGCPADPDDPYTAESVRTALARLLDEAPAA